MRPKASWADLICRTDQCFQRQNREISPLEEGYGGKDLKKRWVLRREWKTLVRLWDMPTTDLGAELEPGDGGEHSEVADWQGTRRDGGSLFHWWGAAYRKERLVVLEVRGSSLQSAGGGGAAPAVPTQKPMHCVRRISNEFTWLVPVSSEEHTTRSWRRGRQRGRPKAD